MWSSLINKAEEECQQHSERLGLVVGVEDFEDFMKAFSVLPEKLVMANRGLPLCYVVPATRIVLESSFALL